ASILRPEMWEGVILSETYFPGLKSVEPNFDKMPIWKKWSGVLEKVGVDMGGAVDFQHLFAAVSKLTQEQMKQLEEELDPFSLRWLTSLARLASTSCGDDIFAEAGLTKELISTHKKPLVALYDEHTAFSATRDYLKNNLPLCTVDDVPAA